MQPEAWNEEYSRLKKLIISLRSSGMLTQQKELKEIGEHVKKLAEVLKGYKLRDAAGTVNISLSEISRREIILENLRKQLPLMTTDSILRNTSATTSSSSRNDNSSNPNRLSSGASATLDIEMHDVVNPANATKGAGTVLTDKGLVQRQQAVMREQDKTIEVISAGVDRLHDMSQTIGHEADLHNTILNGLDENVDTTTAELRQETQRIEEVRKKKSCLLFIYVLSIGSYCYYTITSDCFRV